VNIDGNVEEGTRVKVTFYATVNEIGGNYMELQIEDEPDKVITVRDSGNYWIEEAED